MLVRAHWLCRLAAAAGHALMGDAAALAESLDRLCNNSDVLAHIFSFLGARDVAGAAGATCVAWRAAAVGADALRCRLWGRLAERDVPAPRFAPLPASRSEADARALFKRRAIAAALLRELARAADRSYAALLVIMREAPSTLGLDDAPEAPPLLLAPPLSGVAPRLLRAVRFAALSAAAAELAARAQVPATGRPVLLEEGFFLVAQLGESSLSPAAISRRLDDLAARVLALLPPQTQQVRAQLLAVNRVLFLEEGLRMPLKTEHYATPGFSYVDEVLCTKVGLPIALAAIYEAVCRRVGVPFIRPICLPNFFVLAYVPPRARAVQAATVLGLNASDDDANTDAALEFENDEEVFIACGLRGRFYSRGNLRHFLSTVGVRDPSDPRHLEPAQSPGVVWTRALHNIFHAASASAEGTELASESFSLLSTFVEPFSEATYLPAHAHGLIGGALSSIAAGPVRPLQEAGGDSTRLIAVCEAHLQPASFDSPLCRPDIRALHLRCLSAIVEQRASLAGGDEGGFDILKIAAFVQQCRRQRRAEFVVAMAIDARAEIGVSSGAGPASTALAALRTSRAVAAMRVLARPNSDGLALDELRTMHFDSALALLRGERDDEAVAAFKAVVLGELEAIDPP